MNDMTANVEASTEADADAAMAAIYEKHMSGEADADAPVIEGEAEIAPEGEADAQVPQAPVVSEPPSELPASVKAEWANMTPAMQEAVKSSHIDMGRRMTEMGRVVQGAKPVYDVLIEAARTIPTMENLTPAQIAKDVFTTAQMLGAMRTNPVETLLQVAQQYGALDGLVARLQGQPVNNTGSQMAEENRQLRAHISQNYSEQAIQARIDQGIKQALDFQASEAMVDKYAGQQEFWGDVYPYIPQMIAIVQQNKPNASPQDVLAEAYDMAVHANPATRAKAAAKAPDPALQKAQRVATSVNVKSVPNGKVRYASEDEALAAIWDKHNR